MYRCVSFLTLGLCLLLCPFLACNVPSCLPVFLVLTSCRVVACLHSSYHPPHDVLVHVVGLRNTVIESPLLFLRLASCATNQLCSNSPARLTDVRHRCERPPRARGRRPVLPGPGACVCARDWKLSSPFRGNFAPSSSQHPHNRPPGPGTRSGIRLHEFSPCPHATPTPTRTPWRAPAATPRTSSPRPCLARLRASARSARPASSSRHRWR